MTRGAKPLEHRVGWRPLGDYLVLGFEHILPEGPDHVLFVLGLFLLSPRLKPLLWQVTAFTVAHSITLILSSYEKISLPASVVEPLIAASITLIALENIFSSKLSPWRVLVVFAFGLLSARHPGCRTRITAICFPVARVQKIAHTSMVFRSWVVQETVNRRNWQIAIHLMN